MVVNQWVRRLHGVSAQCGLTHFFPLALRGPLEFALGNIKITALPRDFQTARSGFRGRTAYPAQAWNMEVAKFTTAQTNWLTTLKAQLVQK